MFRTYDEPMAFVAGILRFRRRNGRATESAWLPRQGIARGDAAGRWIRSVSPIVLAVSVIVAGACGAEKPVDPVVLELLGPDDGSSFVIFYGSEIMGSLEGCGCMGNPKLGGLPYRNAFTRAFGTSYPSVASISVDVGFTSSLITSHIRPVPGDVEAAIDTTYAALADSGFTAINLTANDIPVARKYLARDGSPPGVAGLLVSANLEPVSPELTAPQPYVTRRVEASGSRAAFDIAFVGVTEFPGRMDPSSGYRVTDPVVALEREIGRARSQAAIVVVLMYMPASAADGVIDRLGTKPDIAIVASSFGAGSADGSVMGSGLEARLDGPVRVVYSWYKTQKLGVLRVKLGDGGRIESATNSYVKLDAPIVPDADAERMVVRQKEAVRKAKEERYRAEGVQATNASP